WTGAVKRGVEARDLRQVRRTLEKEADRRQVVRLMQRRQRHELLQRRQGFRRDAHRSSVLHPAVNHAMADSDQVSARESSPEERQEVLERSSVVECRPFFPRLFRLDLPAAIASDETWGGAESLDLATDLELQLVASA